MDENFGIKLFTVNSSKYIIHFTFDQLNLFTCTLNCLCKDFQSQIGTDHEMLIIKYHSNLI
jgi:hypothetical protein